MKKLAPYHARGTNEVCRLRTDHFDVGGAWILTDGYTVSVTKQKVGESSTEGVTLAREDFNRLISWYLREQPTAKRS